MQLKPPVKLTRDQIRLDVDYVEPLLQAPSNLPPWPPATIALRNGRTLYVREVKPEEASALIAYVRRLMEVEHDFYDVVGSRVNAELVGWHRKRITNPYVFVGMIDGVAAGMVNGRQMSEDIHISHHTMAFLRGGRVGAALFYCKTYYAFEILGNKEYRFACESPNGWYRWAVGMAAGMYPWPENQHELGGAPIYYITKENWDAQIKDYLRQVVGSDINFDVPDDAVRANEVLRVPDTVSV